MVNVGDKVKIYYRRFWCATGTVVEVQNGRATIAFRDPLENGEWKIITGPERWCDVVKKK